jgi:hypothetical protein
MADPKQALDMIDRLRSMFPDKSDAIDSLEADLELESPEEEGKEKASGEEDMGEDAMEMDMADEGSAPPKLNPEGVRSIKNAFSKNDKKKPEDDMELEGEEEDMFA